MKRAVSPVKLRYLLNDAFSFRYTGLEINPVNKVYHLLANKTVIFLVLFLEMLSEFKIMDVDIISTAFLD